MDRQPESDLLRTGEAADLLGSSRQHVVDLCDQGRLAFVRVGSHRRIRRVEVELLLEPSLTRDQERSLWLHRVVAGRLAVYPAQTLDKARTNLATMRRAHPDGAAARWVARWEKLLAGPVDAILAVLTSSSELAAELRQNSPFAGVLPTHERELALLAFRDHWQREHAA